MAWSIQFVKIDSKRICISAALCHFQSASIASFLPLARRPEFHNGADPSSDDVDAEPVALRYAPAQTVTIYVIWREVREAFETGFPVSFLLFE